ncbi:collagen-like triple helix repeat-containing protein [Maribacter halichondriae]|uniref:collagen-like triple helix repeat-containing protein n=1 Tax=Maribacter halichondriae TaxID=2980554 RepID=UPI0023590968|nr:collagen-like protein [Maribacter sp. Hal144]
MKTRIKLIKRFFSFLLVASLIYACTKDGPIGPIGPQGPTGADGLDGLNGATGEKGETGSVNIIYSLWYEADWGIVNDDYAEFFIDAPEITQEIIDTGLVLAYGKTTGGQFSLLPTTRFNTSTIESYLVAVDEPGTLKIMIRETNNQVLGTPELSMFRYVVIPYGMPVSGKSATIDFSKMTYEEIAAHFDIPD